MRNLVRLLAQGLLVAAAAIVVDQASQMTMAGAFVGEGKVALIGDALRPVLGLATLDHYRAAALGFVSFGLFGLVLLGMAWSVCLVAADSRAIFTGLPLGPALGLVAGGEIANTLNLVARGFVRDFIAVSLGGPRYLVLALADLAIGAGLLLAVGISVVILARTIPAACRRYRGRRPGGAARTDQSPPAAATRFSCAARPRQVSCRRQSVTVPARLR